VNRAAVAAGMDLPSLSAPWAAVAVEKKPEKGKKGGLGAHQAQAEHAAGPNGRPAEVPGTGVMGLCRISPQAVAGGALLRRLLRNATANKLSAPQPPKANVLGSGTVTQSNDTS
jgi:hypothetical protein